MVRLNKQVLHDHFPKGIGTAHPVGLAGRTFDDPNETDGIVIAFGKIIMKSWDDMCSPSYWTGKLVGKHPDQAFKEALNQVQTSHRNSLANIDKRIQYNKILLSQIEKEGV